MPGEFGKTKKFITENDLISVQDLMVEMSLDKGLERIKGYFGRRYTSLSPDDIQDAFMETATVIFQKPSMKEEWPRAASRAYLIKAIAHSALKIIKRSKLTVLAADPAVEDRYCICDVYPSDAPPDFKESLDAFEIAVLNRFETYPNKSREKVAEETGRTIEKVRTCEARVARKLEIFKAQQ